MFSCSSYNIANHREMLWQALRRHSPVQSPWILIGNFNTILGVDDRINGLHVTQGEIRDFQLLVHDLELAPPKSKGWEHTWCNKQEAQNRVYTHIDWALGNSEWMQKYGYIEADFLNP